MTAGRRWAAAPADTARAAAPAGTARAAVLIDRLAAEIRRAAAAMELLAARLELGARALDAHPAEVAPPTRRRTDHNDVAWRWNAAGRQLGRPPAP